jgi:hypothetical protein
MSDPICISSWSDTDYCHLPGECSSSDFDPSEPIAKEYPVPLIPKNLQSPRKNRVRKGEGEDARPDPAGRDRYDFKLGKFFAILNARTTTKQTMKVVQTFCQTVHERAPTGLSDWNRFVKRRKACAYSWLDENAGVIGNELIAQCLVELESKGVIERRVPWKW